jgi:acetate CoA/acetoacetate CoA-transferase beta subunit
MQHTNKGKSKIVRQCTLPMTATRSVDLVVTELAVMAVGDGHLTLIETAPGVTVDEVRNNTDAELVVADAVRQMAI